MTQKQMPQPLPEPWNATKDKPPTQTDDLVLVLAMYDNGLTVQPAIVSAYIAASMPDKYPCWRTLLPNYDFIIFTTEGEQSK